MPESQSHYFSSSLNQIDPKKMRTAAVTPIHDQPLDSQLSWTQLDRKHASPRARGSDLGSGSDPLPRVES